MAGRGDNARPILRRRKVAAGGGHHGGAWKVAYADFVTAMMAFFLLMWLLNATTEEQRKGIADYFSPSIPIARISAGGDGLFEGETLKADDERVESGIGSPEPQQSQSPERDGAAAAAREAETALFRAIETALRGDSGESSVEDRLLRQVTTRVTDEGLIVEIIDRDGPPLFGPGTAEPSPRLAALLGLVAEVAGLLANPIAVEGHTDAVPFAGPGYSNWDLSTDRAQAARRLLEAAGVPTERFRRVTGKAASEPAVADPYAAQNRRIVVTFLRTDLSPDAAPAP